ncbi:ATP-binding protein [Streptomyces sp. NPDC086787]|uniref:ATP-binding protein n=1 Tax=Streptomyces sp. NPDC086787 TaxID=3365759 RepID=UPI0038242777
MSTTVSWKPLHLTGRTWALPSTARAARAARVRITEQLVEWRLPALVDDVVLVGVELVTNSLRHGAAPVSLTLSRIRGPGGRDGVRIEVRDAGSGFDVAAVRAGWPRDDKDCGEGGRGLLLTEMVSECWGSRLDTAGHSVWAHLC